MIRLGEYGGKRFFTWYYVYDKQQKIKKTVPYRISRGPAKNDIFSLLPRKHVAISIKSYGMRHFLAVGFFLLLSGKPVDYTTLLLFFQKKPIRLDARRRFLHDTVSGVFRPRDLFPKFLKSRLTAAGDRLSLGICNYAFRNCFRRTANGTFKRRKGIVLNGETYARITWSVGVASCRSF